MVADFRLSAELLGHETDVRAVKFASPDTVLSASRDGTVRIWRCSGSKPVSFDNTLLSRGPEFINSLTFFPSTRKYKHGLVISGGKDAVIEAKSPSLQSTDNAEHLLIGHGHNVCALDVSPSGSYLVSGGWDGQARIWSTTNWETKVTLEGHSGSSVWAVVALDDNTVVTGCSDKNIRIFDLTQSNSGRVTPKSTIHTPDVVRAVCIVSKDHPSGADIASASNDGIVRLWKLNGQQVGELHGHESFVYSLDTLPSGELVSAGEDRTARIWSGMDCVQTITHPAISVWSVAANPVTGDIVTGSSDGIARVFTRRPDRVANQEALAYFEEAVKSSSIPQQQIGGINKEKLPGPGFLTTKSGTKEGQVQMIKEEDGSITAHQWSIGQQTWISVGTVVNAVGSTGRRVELDGVSYDYVFDVDIEDGKPPLKLPYNLSENPYERATKFLHDHELPLSYLDNVVNFITKNTKGATFDDASPNANLQASPPSRMEDNIASEQRRTRALPQTDYLTILAAKYEAIFTKLNSINSTATEQGRTASSLSPEEQGILRQLRIDLESTKPPAPASIALVVRIITKWPYNERLPGLDVLRCVARYPQAARYSEPIHGTILDVAVESCLSVESPPNENAVMMAIRVVANLFESAEGRGLLMTKADKALSFLEHVVGLSVQEGFGNPNRNILIAISTSALNYSVLVNKEGALSSGQRNRLLAIIGSIMNKHSESEALYRALVAVGTLMSTSDFDTANFDVLAWIKAASEGSSESRIQSIAKECRALAL